MQISTTRFGFVTIHPDDVITFSAGILGLEECRRWVLMADAETDALAWLQSASRPEIALAVVSPRRFVQHYQLRVARRELEPLDLASVEDAEVLAIVGRNANVMTLNLKAPLVINLPRRLGRQVISSGDEAVQHVLLPESMNLRKVA